MNNDLPTSIPISTLLELPIGHVAGIEKAKTMDGKTVTAIRYYISGDIKSSGMALFNIENGEYISHC